MDQNDRVALITGASRGLGHALAVSLAEKGWHIIAVARTVGALEELDDRIRKAGGSATLAPIDVGEPQAMQQLAQALHDRWGGIDLWAHMAVHAAPLSPVPQISGKDWSKSSLINIEVTRGLIALIEPLLTPRQGTALFADDPQAGKPFYGAYGATKAAQIALARSWQAEVQNLTGAPKVVIAAPEPMPTATRARFHPGEDRKALTPCDDVAQKIIGGLSL